MGCSASCSCSPRPAQLLRGPAPGDQRSPGDKGWGLGDGAATAFLLAWATQRASGWTLVAQGRACHPGRAGFHPGESQV